jgi:hypothetical protein
MLEKLNEFDWQNIGLPQIPNLLHGISSIDKNHRQKSYDELYDIGLLDLPKGTPYIIPFLIELLGEALPEKQSVLLLLLQLSSEATIRLKQISDHCDVCRDVLNEISKGIHLCLPFLFITETRATTLQLVSYLRQEADLIAPQLMSLLSSDKSVDKALIIYSLGDLIRDRGTEQKENIQKYRTYFKEMTSSEIENNETRIAAAALLIQEMKVGAPIEAQKIITNAVIEKSHQKSGNIDRLCTFISELGIQRATESLSEIVNSITDAQDIFTVVPILLDIVFNNGKFSSHSKSMTKKDDQLVEINFRRTQILPIIASKNNLTPSQIHVISYLVEQPKIWVYKSNIFELYGLPTSRDELYRFLAK